MSPRPVLKRVTLMQKDFYCISYEEVPGGGLQQSGTNDHCLLVFENTFYRWGL
jgi:hypothetical protein